MNKPIIILIIVAAALVALFVLRKPDAVAPAPIDETPTSEATPAGTSSPIVNEQASAAPVTYSYTNAEFDFAVALPGLVATAKGSSDPIYKPFIFTFGAGDQSAVAEEKRIPNTMAVYVWKNPTEFQLLMSQMSPIATETVNGREFEVYAITEGPRTSYRYATTRNGVTYDVGVWNRADAKKFFLLD